MQSRPTGTSTPTSFSAQPPTPSGVHFSRRAAGASARRVGVGEVSGIRTSKLHIVDLAGSERVRMSGVQGAAMAETQAINLSLTALGA